MAIGWRALVQAYDFGIGVGDSSGQLFEKFEGLSVDPVGEVVEFAIPFPQFIDLLFELVQALSGVFSLDGIEV